MDANGLRFWLLADPRHWRARERVAYVPACRALRLASERTLAPPPAEAAGVAAAALERLPRALDRHGALARWDEAAMAIVAHSHLPGAAVTLALPERPADFAAGFDDVLYVALAGRVLLHDLRGRWPDHVLATPGFAPWRLAADPAGGMWLLERASGRLARLDGCVAPARPTADYAPATFRPDPENPTPPRLAEPLALAWPADERPQALAVAADGTLALLAWAGDGEARVHLVERGAARLGPAQRLDGARFAYALDWLADGRLAVRVPMRHDVPVFAPEHGAPRVAGSSVSPQPSAGPSAQPPTGATTGAEAPADGAGAADPATTGPPAATGTAAPRLAPSGDIYPLADDAREGPFAHRLDAPPRYPLADGGVAPLHRLSVSRLARRGEAANFTAGAAHLIDSGEYQTVWHRLYAEACVPAGCGFTVWLAATAEPAPPPHATDAWCAHVFGAVPDDTLPAGALPRAAWLPQPSELPGHPGLGAWGAPQPRRAGLWTALVQHAGRHVRALAGRFLWVRVVLHGDGRDSPELAALRCYGGRFSYRDHYLPRLYRETECDAGAATPPDTASPAGAASAPAPGASDAAADTSGAALATDAPGNSDGSGSGSGSSSSSGVEHAARTATDTAPRASTPADFLERYLGIVEGWLTALEDRVAAAHLASDPAVAPPASLDWLGAWIGVAFDPVLPAERRRAWLEHAGALARAHGTRRGLTLALDVATGGGVRNGAIVVVEAFRLRRLLATLLGVDLGVADDPLLPGLVVSGNSIVGDTLVLGEAERAELLALFRDEIASAAERDAVRAFYDRLAFRARVLVHQAITPQQLGLIRRIVALEAPAHVEVEVAVASWPLLVGIASLVGVDTWLGPPRERAPARADVSSLGDGDYVLGVGSLDPRLSGGAAAPPAGGGGGLSAPPIADAGADFSAPFGASFELDGSASRAAPGRHLTEFRWRRMD